MGSIFKNLIKRIFFKILFLFYKVIVKINIKDKKTIPSNYVDDIYEIYPSPEEKKYNDKIILPYVQVNNFNRHNLDRPFEVLNISLLKPKTEKTIQLNNTKNCILPVALIDKRDSGTENNLIKLDFDDRKVEIELKYKNRFHYLPIKTKSEINNLKIQTDTCNLAVGLPFYNDTKLLTDKPKLIVHIFVDALSKIIIDSVTEDIMPNINEFFSDGTIFENAFSQADWTLSSMSGVFTGKYSKDHLIFDPRKGDKISDITLAEILKNNGYITSLISSIPKLTPLNGFDKGFDRCVLAPNKDSNYIINEAIEQLDTFSGNQYMFLGFFDIHEAFQLQPISSQVRNEISNFKYKNIKKGTNLSILYDHERLKMCINTIKHFDNKLKSLFKKINQYDEKATVVLHSDHGVDFITKNTQRLSKEREKVSFMIKGSNIDKSIDKSVREIREIPSMILNSINIDNQIIYNNNGFAITESIYPNQEYELSIRNSKYVLFFQVPWNIFKQKLAIENHYKTSFHEVINENKISNNNDYVLMLQMALDHYADLIKNLKESQDQ